MAAVAQAPVDPIANCRPSLVAVYAGAARTGRTGVEWYDSRYWQSGWADAQSIPRAPDPKAYDKREAHPLEDCSSQQYLCVKAGGLDDVYAIPRGKLAAGQNYTHVGREFTVLGCYGTGCRSYVVVATLPCKERCDGVPRGHEGEIDRLLFIYERAHGITVYGTLTGEQSMTADDVSKFTDTNVQQSAWMLLRSEVGLLACQR
jgi:hypothetical protein